MWRVDFLSAPSNFLVQCFRNSDSKDLGLRDLGIQRIRSLDSNVLVPWIATYTIIQCIRSLDSNVYNVLVPPYSNVLRSLEPGAEGKDPHYFHGEHKDYVYIYIYIHTCMYVCVYICMCVYNYTYIYIYIYMYKGRRSVTAAHIVAS